MRENVDSNDWFVFNDKDVSKKNAKNYITEIKNRTPYILFYMQK